MMHKVTFSDPVVAGEHLNTALRSDTGWRNYMKPWTTSTIDCRLDVYMKYYVRERLVVVGVLVLAVFAPAAATVADGGLKEEVQKVTKQSTIFKISAGLFKRSHVVPCELQSYVQVHI